MVDHLGSNGADHRSLAAAELTLVRPPSLVKARAKEAKATAAETLSDAMGNRSDAQTVIQQSISGASAPPRVRAKVAAAIPDAAFTLRTHMRQCHLRLTRRIWARSWD